MSRAKRTNGSDDMAADFQAIEQAMTRDHAKNPPLGSPAWVRRQEQTTAADDATKAPFVPELGKTVTVNTAMGETVTATIAAVSGGTASRFRLSWGEGFAAEHVTLHRSQITEVISFNHKGDLIKATR
jgi:hypothetical protein